MGGRVIVAAALAAVVTFVWGFAFWGMGIPQRVGMMGSLPGNDDSSAGAKLQELVGADGATKVYVYPWYPSKNQNLTGTFVQLFYTKEGAEPMSPRTFALGWLHYFVLALLAGTLLKMSMPALPAYGQRACLVSIVGLIGAIWTTLAGAIWFSHPWRYAIGDAIYGIVAGLLMAVILAAIIKPRPVGPS